MEIKPGRYRHFKGNEYEVLGTARHSETEEELVVYRALYGEGGLWVRPVSMWTETVERNGQRLQRFSLMEEEELPENIGTQEAMASCVFILSSRGSSFFVPWTRYNGDVPRRGGMA